MSSGNLKRLAGVQNTAVRLLRRRSRLEEAAGAWLKTPREVLILAGGKGHIAMEAGYSWLSLLIESSFASRLLINRENNIVFANRAAHRLFGYADNELAGKPIDVLFASRRDRERAIPQIPSFSSRIVGDDLPIRGVTKRGDELILRVGTTPIDTLVESFLSVTVFDITSFKQKERELLLRTRELEEANRRISDFAHVIAHDLGAALAEIHAISERLSTALAESRLKEASQAGAALHDLAGHACDVVNDLMEYNRENSSKGRSPVAG